MISDTWRVGISKLESIRPKRPPPKSSTALAARATSRGPGAETRAATVEGAWAYTGPQKLMGEQPTSISEPPARAVCKRISYGRGGSRILKENEERTILMFPMRPACACSKAQTVWG